MTMRNFRYTNVLGNQTVYGSDFLITSDRHNHREAKSQKAQLKSEHMHGVRKDYKIPIKHKLT